MITDNQLTQPVNKIADEVMQKIKKDEVKMKPKWWFVVGAVLSVVGIILSVFLSSFLVNVLTWKFRVDAPHEYLRLGRSGFGIFLQLFPWSWLILSISSSFLGFHLLRQYDFSYKKDWWLIVLSGLLIVICLSGLISVTGLDDSFEHLPGTRQVYRPQVRGNYWVIGEILEIDNSQWKVLSADEEMVLVHLSGEIWMPPHFYPQKGLWVRLAGEWQSNVFWLRGVFPAHQMPSHFPQRF